MWYCSFHSFYIISFPAFLHSDKCVRVFVHDQSVTRRLPLAALSYMVQYGYHTDRVEENFTCNPLTELE